jgi:hypothetical protein
VPEALGFSDDPRPTDLRPANPLAHQQTGGERGLDITWTLRAMPAPEWVVEQWPGSAMIIAVRSKGKRGRKLIDETRYYVSAAAVDAQVRDPIAGPCRRRLKGGRSPPPSEGQQSLQLRIQDWLGLLGLTLRVQIIEEPSQADEASAPAFISEEKQ